MCDEEIMPIYGERFGELLYDPVNGEGRIMLGREFAYAPDIIQKDLLVDWKALLENLYNDLCALYEGEEEDGV